jgi:hypothetical protein
LTGRGDSAEDFGASSRLSVCLTRSLALEKEFLPMTSRLSAVFASSALAASAIFATGCSASVQTAPPPPPPSVGVQVRPAPPVVGAHPAYIHALQELRFARLNLLRRGGDTDQRWDERVAVSAIDHAIGDVREAAVEDGKDLGEHPAFDDHEPRAGRLHKALASLETARREIAQEEDNRDARSLRNRAIKDIDEATQLTRDGIAHF